MLERTVEFGAALSIWADETRARLGQTLERALCLGVDVARCIGDGAAQGRGKTCGFALDGAVDVSSPTLKARSMVDRRSSIRAVRLSKVSATRFVPSSSA